MAAFDPLLAHDLLQGAAGADQRWLFAQQLFRAQGIDWLTAGTAPRTRLDCVTVRTTLPERVMADYLSARLFADDPWMDHAAISNAVDAMNIETARHGALGDRCQRLCAVFAVHGLRHVSLLPAYGGARPGALVLYAAGRAEAMALRDPAHQARLRALGAIVAAHCRPEDGLGGAVAPQTGHYLINPPLTPRERGALLRLSQGLRTAQIAHRMGIAPVTVDKHLRQAREKLGARTREQTLAFAIRDGLIAP